MIAEVAKLGWKSPIKVVPEDIEIADGGTRQQITIDPSEPLTNDFLAVDSYGSFKSFIETYGLILFEPYLTVPTTLFWTEIPEDVARFTWDHLKKRIRKWQKQTIELMIAKPEGEPEYRKLVKRGQARMAKKKTVQGFEAEGDDSSQYYFMLASDMEDAVFMQVLLTDRPIELCGRGECRRPFIQHNKGRVYCSPGCKLKDHMDQETASLKNVLRGRVNRNKKLSPNGKAEIRGAITDARTVKALEKVEKDFGLAAKNIGRRSSKGER